jgi:hypothetical protein
MKPDIEQLLDGLGPPQPPPDLRSRVLSAARSRMAGEPVNDFWSMIWNNRGVRLAWVASVVLLLTGHVLVGTGNGPVVAPDLVTENQVDDYFVEMLRPVRISDSAQPVIGLFASAGDPTEIDMEGNAS